MNVKYNPKSPEETQEDVIIENNIRYYTHGSLRMLKRYIARQAGRGVSTYSGPIIHD